MSNIYPAWWNTSLTIYNKYTDKQTKIDRWYKSTVNGAFWKYAGDKVTIGQTVLQTNNIICRIRKDDKFLEDYLWKALPNDQMLEHFTLQGGDIIVKGIVDDVIDEYTAGSRSSDLLKKYKEQQGCMKIEVVQLNVDGGRGQEHYYVKGI